MTKQEQNEIILKNIGEQAAASEDVVDKIDSIFALWFQSFIVKPAPAVIPEEEGAIA